MLPVAPTDHIGCLKGGTITERLQKKQTRPSIASQDVDAIEQSAGCLTHSRKKDRRVIVMYPTSRDFRVSISWSRAGSEESAVRVAEELLSRFRKGASQEEVLELKETLLPEGVRLSYRKRKAVTTQVMAASKGLSKRTGNNGPCKAETRASEILGDRDHRISDSDVLEVLRLWKFRKNRNRTNVMRPGQICVESEMLGVVFARMYCKCGIAAATRRCPAVTKLLCQYINDNPPSGIRLGECFPFTTICINRGYAAARHRDHNNEGISVVRALGRFTGGQLLYWASDHPPSDRDNHTQRPEVTELDARNAKVLDVQTEFCYVDGRKAHEVESFEGERYSLVYFTVTKRHLLERKLKASIQDVYGIKFPESAASEEIWQRLLSNV